MATRYLYLIRHGQYDPSLPSPDAMEGELTALGKKQARQTGKALKDVPVTAIHYSTLRRAEQTALLIAEEAFAEAKQHRTQRLWECVPCQPSLPGAVFHFTPEQLGEFGKRADDAFAHYFKATRGEDKHEILVSHGNLIRYFVCRVLCADPAQWLHMETHNCGITRVSIPQDGIPRLISFNDIGHLPANLRTDNFHI